MDTELELAVGKLGVVIAEAERVLKEIDQMLEIQSRGGFPARRPQAKRSARVRLQAQEQDPV
jgi:hypothetical protein